MPGRRRRPPPGWCDDDAPPWDAPTWHGRPPPWVEARRARWAERVARRRYRAWRRHDRRRRRRWGLRRRLAFAFAFVALAAVFLTTFLTLGAVFRAQHQLAAQGPPVGVFREAFLAALLSFLLASAAAGVVTRFLTRPLTALTEGARRLAAGERALRLRLPRADDELRVLTEAFNQLTEGLEREEAWRRDMVADVAHDLRTPLAVLRSEIEAMQDGVRQPDADGLERLHGEVMMLSRLVEDLRTLSLAEAGGVTLRRVDTRLRPLLERARDGFETRAADAGAALTLADGDPSLHASIDPDRIQQVLGNLIDNALRHGAGAPVELAARAERGGVVLSVRDHGPGLPPGDPQRVFERFYRGDPARGRPAGAPARVGERGGGRAAGGGGEAQERDGGRAGGPAATGASAGPAGAGSGLGLAIVKALVEAHGGRVEARNHERGGALFTVWLPVTAPAA